MTDAARQALEVDGVIALLRRYTSSPLGAARLDDLAAAPRFDSPQAARERLEEVGEAMEWIRALDGVEKRSLTPIPRFQGLRDVRPSVELLDAEGAVLEAPDIYALLEALDRADETRQRIWRERVRRPKLGFRGDQIAEFRPLLRELSGKILPNGEIADHASSGLARVRRQIERQRVIVHQSLERFVRKHFDEGLLQDDYATIRNGRSVVPVKSSFKGRIEGVVHSASGTGQTVFVEPLETITQNNKLVALIEEEQREVLKVLREMTARLALQKEEIEPAIEQLADLELIFAKARFGYEFKACLPTFSEGDEELKLDWARHPLLEDVLRRSGGKVAPLSIQLVRGSRVLVVSGPNAGGKTVVLKTVGLLAIMAQSGIPVPAAEAVFPWFGRILAAIGDAQSIEASLSTFSAHVQELKSMLDAATGKSLVLIDELGGATDPQEGGALAVAVVEHFLKQGTFALVSTHLPALKVYAAGADGVVSAAMGFDERTLSPTYRLLVGVPGRSAGLSMAERFGLPKEIIVRARAALAEQDEQASTFLRELHIRVEDYQRQFEDLRLAEKRLRERERELLRQTEEREKEKLAELERQFAKAIREAELANQKALEEAMAKVDQAASGKRALANAQRAVAKAQRESKERLRSAASASLGESAPKVAGVAVAELKEGQTVKLGGFGAQGKVTRKLGDDKWEVQVGQLKMQVRPDDVTEILSPDNDSGKSDSLPSGVTYSPASASARDLTALTEINVIGRRADEAQREVDKFLDEAVLADVRRLRVIHGHGANILRRSLWQLFANHTHVERYYQAESREGGAGATIVEIRD